MEFILNYAGFFQLSNPGFPLYFLASFLIALVIYAKLHCYRISLIKKGLPALQLGFLDFLGHIKTVPSGYVKRKVHPPNVYLFQAMCGTAELFRKQKMYLFWMIFKPAIVLINADTVEDLLSSTSTSVLQKSWTYFVLHPWLGTGLLTSNGAKWKSRRKLLTPSFHFDILKDFIPVFNEQCQVLVDILKQETHKEWIDIVQPITLCSLDIICETTLGVHIGAQRNSYSNYVQAVSRASATVTDRIMKPLYWSDFFFYHSSTGRQFKKDLDVLHKFTREVIQTKKQLLSSASSDAIPLEKRKRKALMDLLLDHHMNYGDIDEEDIREEIDTFAFEGHDTTSMGISWTLYLIGLYPEIQKKVHEELDSLFHGSDCEVTTDDLKEMKYLECVIKESQRLYPSVPFFGRQLTKETTIGGHKIPANTGCNVLVYMLHRDPEVFPNPEVFDPDRFLPEAAVGRHPYAFIPFSAGPRNCIGQRFAMMEMKTIVASVLRYFNLKSLEHRDNIIMTSELILRSTRPIKVKISQRETPV